MIYTSSCICNVWLFIQHLERRPTHIINVQLNYIHFATRNKKIITSPRRSQGSWVRYSVWQHTFVSPSAFSRRAVVSYWRKYVHEVLVNRLGGLSLPRKSVVRLTDRPDMTLDVYRGRKTTIQQYYYLTTETIGLTLKMKEFAPFH